MRSTNRRRTLLVSSAVILLCMTVIVGMTWALFTDTETVSNHLQAGQLNITLVRTRLEKTVLDNSTGYLVTPQANTTELNFSDPANNDKNVFDITDSERLVPGSSYTATMEIRNSATNSDVGFKYWLELRFNDPNELTEQFAKQLEVIVETADGQTKKVPVSESAGLIGDAKTPIGNLSKGAFESFRITVNFIDDVTDLTGTAFEGIDNDLTMTQDLSFDLVVHAVQATSAT